MKKISYKNLMKDSMIFAIGGLGSKLVIFLLIPFYTYHITSSEFGTYDLINTTINLLLPIFNLAIFESTLRFTLDSQYNKKTILTNSFFIFFLSIIPISMTTILLLFFTNLDSKVIIFSTVTLLLQSFQKIIVQFIRGIKLVKLFAANGIMLSILTSLLSIFFVAYYNMGLIGILYATTLSLLISNIWLIKKGEILKFLNIRLIDKKVMFEMFSYSLPLIPNTVSLWATSSINRVFILYYLSTADNGIFAVAFKVAAIMTLVNSFFFQSWQIVASEHYDSKDRDSIYKNVFNNFSTVMILIATLLILLIKPTYGFIVEESYYEGWRYVPFLIVASVFSSFSSFIGTNYSASKKTNGVFKTTVLGSLTNIILCVLLIPIFGLYGVSYSLLISYLVIWYARIKDTEKILGNKTDYTSTYIQCALLILQSLSTQIINNAYLNILVQVIFVLLFIISNYKFIKNIILKGKYFLNNKKGGNSIG